MVMLSTVSIILAVGLSVEPQEMSVAEVKTLRFQGHLAEAMSIAEQQIRSHPNDRLLNIEFHLELARLHDRVGLHHNSRPVIEALEHFDLAESLAKSTDAAALGS